VEKKERKVRKEGGKALPPDMTTEEEGHPASFRPPGSLPHIGRMHREAFLEDHSFKFITQALSKMDSPLIRSGNSQSAKFTNLSYWLARLGIRFQGSLKGLQIGALC
jgi:hypothetical protein